MPACIYCIENKINGHCYIDQIKNFIQRRSKHFSELRRNAHHNSHLQKAYNKYGEQNFQIYILEEQIADILQMTPVGYDVFWKNIKSQVKINTVLSDDEVKCILQTILDEQHRAKILGVETMRKQ